MQLQFTKMNGAGNDFVLMDNRSGEISLTPEQIARICHRQRGVGADGLMLLVDNESGDADWSWQFFNSDGSHADMCGNGARCFARYVQKTAGNRGAMTFKTGAGIIHAEFDGELVTVGLTPPKDLKLKIPVPLNSGEVETHFVNTGVEHAVIFVEDADAAMVSEVGHEVRFHQVFQPKGTNVNFVQILGDHSIRVRTYERGVEGETLACGTGVCASAIISSELMGMNQPLSVKVQGGDLLNVLFDKGEDGTYSNIRLKGPADFCFSGVIGI